VGGKKTKLKKGEGIKKMGKINLTGVVELGLQ
jgi:hypothetical protein